MGLQRSQIGLLITTSAMVALVPASGCELARAPIGPTTGIDAGPIDAPEGFDAPIIMDDVPGLDAPIMLDAPDAPPMMDGGSCTPTGAETCNGRDDDCDGHIDDGGVCQACTSPGSCSACIQFEAGGHVYQSCPAVSGLQYWGMICYTLGAGWAPAVPDTASESVAISGALTAAGGTLDATHWIGVNDFETNGSYVLYDGTPLAWSPPFSDTSAPRDVEGIVALRADGNWDDYPLGSSLRSLCELVEPVTACIGGAAGDSTCDGVDDDCDGFIDENCIGTRACTSRRFWNSIYYTCTDDMNWDTAVTECTAMGGSELSTLDDRFELQFADWFASADTWVGLAQDAGATEPDGWRWLDGTAFLSSDPDWSASWDASNPTTSATENCGYIKNSSGRLQDAACGGNKQSILCELPIP